MKERIVFWGRAPKKLPRQGIAEGSRDSVGPFQLAQLLFHSLFFSPKGSPLCDAKYPSKIFCRNLHALLKCCDKLKKMFVGI